jgi:hypothetical protein
LNASHELSQAVENAAKLKFNGETHESIPHSK